MKDSMNKLESRIDLIDNKLEHLQEISLAVKDINITLAKFTTEIALLNKDIENTLLSVNNLKSEIIENKRKINEVEEKQKSLAAKITAISSTIGIGFTSFISWLFR